MADNKHTPTENRDSATIERDRQRETANKAGLAGSKAGTKYDSHAGEPTGQKSHASESGKQGAGKSDAGNGGKSDGASGQRSANPSGAKLGEKSGTASDKAR